MEQILFIGRDTVPAKITIGAGEKLFLTLVALPGVHSEVPMLVELTGDGAEADIAALYSCTDDDRLALNIDLRHETSGCTSRQLVKGLAAGHSCFSFNGRILVKEGSMRTKASQENHNILLSEDATAETRPQLEIYADDVECSHGATVGRLNEDELYYMRSRGIPEKEARKLQIISFLAPVLSRLPESIREDVIERLSI